MVVRVFEFVIVKFSRLDLACSSSRLISLARAAGRRRSISARSRSAPSIAFASSTVRAVAGGGKGRRSASVKLLKRSMCRRIGIRGSSSLTSLTLPTKKRILSDLASS